MSRDPPTPPSSLPPPPPPPPGKKGKGKEKRKILFISHHYIKCISLPRPWRGDPASPPCPPPPNCPPSSRRLSPSLPGQEGSRDGAPQPAWPRGSAWGEQGRGCCLHYGVHPPPPNPSWDSGKPSEVPNHHPQRCPHGGGGGVAPRNPSHWWARGGGPLKSKGGEIKLGLTPSEL